MKVCNARYTFNKVLEYFPFVTEESQILIGPNFPWNNRIQCLLGTFNIWMKLSDAGVNLWDESVLFSKPHK